MELASEEGVKASFPTEPPTTIFRSKTFNI
jgi:hypothetical protein